MATLLLAGGVAVALRAPAPVPRADFTYINRGSFNTLDPGQMNYHQDIMVAMALWEGLTSPVPGTLEAGPGTAAPPFEVDADRRRYVFSLRPDARWSNGDPVTAADFVRGWRRAIEPGTADVYSELIAAHIEGARAYVNWRGEAVSVLSLVRQLQKGSPLDRKSAATALRTAAGAALLARLGFEPVEGGPDAAGGALDRLRSAPVDWERLGDELLDEHAAEMDRRFAQVGVRVLDPRTLEVRLARPAAYFLDLTWFPIYYPVHESIELLRERYKGRLLADTGIVAYDPQWTKPDYRRRGYPGLITNGPYRLTDWVFKQRLRMERNPHYWNAAAVRSATIESIDVEYQNSAWMLFEQGYADMMSDLAMDYTPELVRAVRRGLRDDVHAIPAFGTYYYELNARPVLWDGRPNPVADARVRRALALAVDRQQLVDHIVRLDNPVSATLVPPGQIPGYRSPPGLRRDPDRARSLLAEAGYPGGAGLAPIEILYNTGFRHEDAAQAIKRMWETELGVRVELVGRETKAFAEDKARGRFIVARSGWFGDYLDPTTFLDMLYSTNGHNFPGLRDARYDGLLDAAAVEPDPTRRLALLSEAEGYLLEGPAVILPLYTYVSVYAWKPNVRGLTPNPRMTFPFQYIYVEKR